MSENISLVPTAGMDFSTHILILRGYVVLSDFGKNPVHYKTVVDQLNVSRTQVSGVNSFFVGLGFLQQIDTGTYTPTKCAIEFYSKKPGEESFENAKACVAQSDLYNRIKSLVLIHGEVSWERVVSEIMRASGTTVKSRAERALEWLMRCDLIQKDKTDAVILS
ncbi:MAG: hypothetical protein ACFFER_07765 [Candidatus Thorarchaeota archaeon]